jgi:signal transduction histidine kinase
VTLPSFLRSIRFRLALTYSLVVFGLALLMIAGVNWAVSQSLDDQPVSRQIEFRTFIDSRGRPLTIAEITPMVDFEQAVNQRALEDLRKFSLWALTSLFPLSIGAGWVIADRALRPIGHITEVAKEIQATDLSRRIGLAGPDDELKELADTFDAMLDRVEAGVESQRSFIQDTSHELRNPLAVMAANLDVVLADPDATVADLRETATVVRRTVDRATKSVDDLVIFARRDVPESVREDVSLRDIAESVLTEYRGPLEEAALHLTWLGDDVVVGAERGSLKRAFDNLVNNAVRLTRRGSTLRIATGRVGDFAWLGIEDEGPGIDPRDHEAVFQRHWSGDETSLRAERRSGLGLAIARQIAKAHGGELTVRSVRGAGAAFVLWFPLVPGADRLAVTRDGVHPEHTPSLPTSTNLPRSLPTRPDPNLRLLRTVAVRPSRRLRDRPPALRPVYPRRRTFGKSVCGGVGVMTVEDKPKIATGRSWRDLPVTPPAADDISPVPPSRPAPPAPMAGDEPDTRPLPASAPPAVPPSPPGRRTRRVRWPWLVGLAVLVVAIGALLAWSPWTDRTPGLAAVDPAEVPGLPPDASEPVAAVAARLLPSVVQIERFGAEGSGFAYAEGRILTAAHVVAGAREVTVRTSDGLELTGRVLGGDPVADIAVVAVDGDVPPAELAVGDPPDVGQLAVAIGSPLGFSQSVTSGIVSAVDRTLTVGSARLDGLIQTDAPINQGNSGGPLADRQGRVIGVNVAIASFSGGSDGLGFAVGIDKAVEIADRFTAAAPEPETLDPGASPFLDDPSDLFPPELRDLLDQFFGGDPFSGDPFSSCTGWWWARNGCSIASWCRCSPTDTACWRVCPDSARPSRCRLWPG